jgi:hypothetical protein
LTSFSFYVEGGGVTMSVAIGAFDEVVGDVVLPDVDVVVDAA